VAGVVAVVSQFGWAVVITVIAAALDGVPADDYSAPNRAAFGFLLILLAMVLPLGAFVAYTIAHALRVRLSLAVGIAQVPAVVALVWIVASW
jgi:hypothetical protein